ncbi:helix-turn-helix domain-containing protein [Mycolicibacterium chlorophenolicum]|nr:helix-turn-helix transcriptional regulator [Mycolicibacterium chlorophenolicum]
MPAASPRVIPPAATDLAEVGAAIKRRRTELAYSMVEAARTAGVSRVTLHRIERGNASVTIGAYAAVAHSLGLAIAATAPPDRSGHNMIQVRDYPQLKALAWNLRDDVTLSDEEALALYERNWRHVDQEALNADEQELIQRLTRAAGHEGRLLV